MRVLHLLKTAVGATWALRQTRELVKHGIEVHLALPDGPMVQRYNEVGVKTHILDPSLVVPKLWKNKAAALALRNLITEIKPDIVHSHFVATTLLMRYAMKGLDIPRIFHIPGPLHLEHLAYRHLDVNSAGANDYYLASCIWTKEALARFGVEQEKIGLAYYGVNAEDFTKPNRDAEDLRAMIGAGDSTFVVGMVAYFYAPKPYLGQTRGLKGHEDLIDAIAIVKAQHPDIKCVMVGGPWGNAQRYYEKVKRYAQKKVGDTCVFLGNRNDVPSLYPQFDLAVHPSHSENVGGAVESMYARVPTLTSNVGGFPDLVVPGDTGYMAVSKYPPAFAEQILRAIEEGPNHDGMVDRAFNKVTSVMNVEHNALEVMSFYDQVMKHWEAKPRA